MNTKPRRKPEVDYNILEEEFTSPDTLTDTEYIYLYLDEGSYRKAGRKIGVSSSLYYNQLQKVKARILKALNPEPIDY